MPCKCTISAQKFHKFLVENPQTPCVVMIHSFTLLLWLCMLCTCGPGQQAPKFMWTVFTHFRALLPHPARHFYVLADWRLPHTTTDWPPLQAQRGQKTVAAIPQI